MASDRMAAVLALLDDDRQRGANPRQRVAAQAAAELGVRAVFALPLRIGAISVGALLAHSATPGPLIGGALADAFALAGAVTLLLLHRQSTGTGRTGPAAEVVARRLRFDDHNP